MANKKRLSLVLGVILIISFNLGIANAAKALYAFGDSFADTGNAGLEAYPYGITWPGEPGFRASDGRNEVDYFAELIGVPSPTPSSQLKNDSQSVFGVNFAQKGAGVTYAFGMTTLDSQVSSLASLVERRALSTSHLHKSVALVSLGVNDYGAFNGDFIFNTTLYASEVNATVTTIVDGIALALLRLHGLGLRNVIVTNLANMVCSPFITVASNYTSCSSNNTLLYESQTHNAFLRERVRLLNQELPSANFVVADQYKAFDHLFHNGAKYGFENPLVPCCIGSCSKTDDAGQPLYKLCQNPKAAVIFDGIHPTDAAWKVVINLYALTPGFTQEGPNLKAWMRRNRM